MVKSPTESCIRWCMHGDLMWTSLVWAKRSTVDNFWVPSHRFNSATGEQKGITQTIYTDSEPPSRTPNSLMPSSKLRSANLPFLCLWCDTVGDRTPASRTSMLRGGGLLVWAYSNTLWLGVLCCSVSKARYVKAQHTKATQLTGFHCIAF